MKQSQVKPGVRALLSLGHRGAVAVKVEYQRTPERAGDVRWVCVDSSGVYRTATSRQLQPLPVTDASGKLIGFAGAAGGVYPVIAGKRFTGLGYVGYVACAGCRSEAARRDGGGHLSTCPRF